MTTYNQHLLCGLTALSFVAPLTSFAHAAAFENGFYVGAKIGGQEAMANWDQTSSVFFSDRDNKQGLGTDAIDQDGESFHTNLMGNLGIGYARIVEKFFLAAELSVNLAAEQEFSWRQSENVSGTAFIADFVTFTTGRPRESAQLDSINQNIKTEVSLENPDIILDLRPGFLLAKNFLLYGRIGVAFNKLSIEQEGSVDLSSSFCESSGCIEQLNAFVPVNSEEDKDVYGLRVGLGMEYKFTPNLGINMDYVFTDYGSIDTEFSSHDTFTDNFDFTDFSQTNISSSADVTKSTATVGFNWYFGGKK